MNKEKFFFIEARKLVSKLIFKVLTKNLCVREALKSFPKNIKDPSVQCAWHALIHYEADEDHRNASLEYTKEQDDYIEMLAFILQEGEKIPINIINSYREYYKID
ncbi:MAG: hypothetical protein V2B14_05260 [bacterium]